MAKSVRKCPNCTRAKSGGKPPVSRLYGGSNGPRGDWGGWLRWLIDMAIDYFFR